MSERRWLQITCGRGPRECAFAVPHVLKRMIEETRQHGLSTEVLESVAGRYPGTLYSALLAVDGANAEAYLSRWVGTVCWICRSPFRPNHKRKNWFVSVDAFRPPATVMWSERDLRFETLRASGPGGQHVNKTESAVRVTHVPTNVSVTAREERSQHANRKLALARLAELFRQRERSQAQQFENERWSQHNQLERGRAVRTFIGLDFEEERP
jgi:peptide chain release factor